MGYGPKPVRYIVEVQLMLSEYLAMRKQSHIWYKMLRATQAGACRIDFLKYGAQASPLLEKHLSIVLSDAVVDVMLKPARDLTKEQRQELLHKLLCELTPDQRQEFLLKEGLQELQE